MDETEDQNVVANSSTNEPPKGHDFRQLNEVAKDLLCVSSENNVPDLYLAQQLSISLYGLTYDGAPKACPWETKTSDKLPPFLCRTTEPNTHCPYLPECDDAEFAFKSGRCQILENVKKHPDGRMRFRDLWSEGGRQYAVLSHLRGRQKNYETPFVSAHDSLNRSIGRGVKCNAANLTIISTRKLVELGYPIIQCKVAMVDYSLGTDKAWLFNTEWLLLWHVPRAAIIKNYQWSEVQTKAETLAGSKFRKQVALHVYDFETSKEISPSYNPDEDPPSSDEEPHFAKKRLERQMKKLKKVKKGTNNSAATPIVQESSKPIRRQSEEPTPGDEDDAHDSAQKVGFKRKRIPQQEVEGFEPHTPRKYPDMASFAESAKTQGYARTFLQATVPRRTVYTLAKLPGYPTYTFLQRRDSESAKERRGLSTKDLTSLRITAKPAERSEADKHDDENVVDHEDQLVSAASTQTYPQDFNIADSIINFDQSDGLALLASRLNVELAWLRNLTEHSPEAHGFVRVLIAQIIEQNEEGSDSDLE